MPSGRAVNGVAEFYAHAIAIEREAAQRYEEFALHMKDQEQDTARLFSRLARQGFAHAREIGIRAKGMKVPRLSPGRYAWLDKGAPEPSAHEWVFRLMSPRCALEVALHAERRARRYFGQVARTTGNRGVKAIARKFVEEEGAHISRMRRAMVKVPNPVLDWEKIYERGGPTRSAQGTTARSPAGSPARSPARTPARSPARSPVSRAKRIGAP